MTLESTERVFVKWLGRLAFIPLAVYAIGLPLELAVRGSVTLYADQFLPLEIIGLALCFIFIVAGMVIG